MHTHDVDWRGVKGGVCALCESGRVSVGRLLLLWLQHLLVTTHKEFLGFDRVSGH